MGFLVFSALNYHLWAKSYQLWADVLSIISYKQSRYLYNTLKDRNICDVQKQSVRSLEWRWWQVSFTGLLDNVSFDNWELSWKNQGFKYSRSWEVRFRNLRLPILKIIVKTSKRRHTPKMAVVCSQSLFDKTVTCWNVVKLRSLGGGLRKKQRLLKPMIPQVVDPLHSIPPKNTVTILRKYSACPIFSAEFQV